MQDTTAPTSRLAVAFLLALAVLAVAAVVGYTSFQRLSSASEAVAHTREMRAELTRALSALQDAETGQRGFVITGDPAYLAPYRTALRDLPERLTRLEALTTDDPAQRRVVRELREIATGKLRELREAIRVRRSAGLEAAQRVVRSGRGKQEMDRARELIGEMARNEDALYAPRAREATAALVAARLSFALTAILGLAGIAFVYALALRRLRHVHALAAERRRADESQGRLAAIVGSSDDAIIGKTLDGLVTSWNQGAERIFGYTAEEMIGQPISRIAPPERPDEMRTILDAIRRGERVDHYETERVRKDGRRINVSLAVSAIRDPAGRIIGASKIARDVTERKRAEERSRRLLRFNQAIITHMGEGLYTVDAQGLVTFINPAAARMFGWTAAELVGRRMHDVTHYAHPDGTPFPAEECPGLQVVKQGTPLRDQADFFIRKDGTFFPVLYSSSPIETEGQVSGVIVVFRDVTRQSEAEAEREALLAITERARAEAEAASRAKDAFLATISHELRTPLSPILAWSRMLQRGTLDAGKAARAVETIERCAKAQAQLVEDLLDVSRIVSGKLRLDVRPVDLAPVVHAAVDVVRPAAEAKGIRLHAVVDPRTGRVSGDPDRLQQVVWNLLSNAVKFTPKGGRVQVVLEKVNSHVEIAVSDTGEGISPDFLPHVFERFQQADQKMDRMHAGLGLGLAIVRHIVELHGGTVHAESPGAGQGAVFTVKLPLIVIARTAGEAQRRHPGAPGEAAEERAYPSLDGVRVLLVDDDPDSNEVVRTLLASCGAEVEVAASTAQALQTLEGFRPDVLVSDIGMPAQDGYALIRSVRGRDGGRLGRLPAVALTAYTSVEDRVRLFSAGFQAHLTKPFDPAELVAVVASVVRDPDPP
jgi:PAS domain S-box-containing protein